MAKVIDTPKLTAKEIVDLNRQYTFFSWSVQGQVQPIPVTRAEGVYFWDADGKRYLDFASQLVNSNVGHQHPKVVKAIQEQAAQLLFGVMTVGDDVFDRVKPTKVTEILDRYE